MSQQQHSTPLYSRMFLRGVLPHLNSVQLSEAAAGVSRQGLIHTRRCFSSNPQSIVQHEFLYRDLVCVNYSLKFVLVQFILQQILLGFTVRHSHTDIIHNCDVRTHQSPDICLVKVSVTVSDVILFFYEDIDTQSYILKEVLNHIL